MHKETALADWTVIFPWYIMDFHRERQREIVKSRTHTTYEAQNMKVTALQH